MQIVDNGAPVQIKKVLAASSITHPPSLPPANMGKGMLNGHSFTKLSASLRGLLTLAQLDQQGFIGVNTHATPFRAGCALGFERTLSADIFGKMNDPTGHKGHFLVRWTANGLPFPIQRKRLLGKVLPLANRPGFAVDLQVITPLMHEMTTSIGPIDMEFL